MKLNEIINICKDFIDKPNDEKATSAYNNLLQNIVVRAYIPMQEKVIALVRMTIDSEKDEDIPASMFTAGLEIACLFDGLLSYTNIDPEVNIKVKTYENYDILYQSGFADYVLGFCERDYDRLVRMMERTFSFENLLQLIDGMKQLDTGALAELKVVIQNATKEADPEMIKNLTEFVKLNDPYLVSLKEKIESDAMEEALKNNLGDKV